MPSLSQVFQAGNLPGNLSLLPLLHFLHEDDMSRWLCIQNIPQVSLLPVSAATSDQAAVLSALDHREGFLFPFLPLVGPLTS